MKPGEADEGVQGKQKQGRAKTPMKVKPAVQIAFNPPSTDTDGGYKGKVKRRC